MNSLSFNFIRNFIKTWPASYDVGHVFIKKFKIRLFRKEKFLFVNFDFSTYPRGRVLYNNKCNSHIIYVDDCIKKGEIKQIVKLFEITKICNKKILLYYSLVVILQ